MPSDADAGGQESQEDKPLNPILAAGKSVIGYVGSYFAETTVHGFHYVIEGRNRIEKAIWIFFITLAISYAGNIL